MKKTRYFECQKCGAILKQIVDKDKYVKPPEKPEECYENQGGCGRNQPFLELKEEWVKEHLPNHYDTPEKTKGFTNSVIEKLHPIYQKIPWDKKVIREITYFLNDNYSDSCTIPKLVGDIEFLLGQHGQIEHTQAYMEYFQESGMLEQKDGVYVIHKTKKLPKRKKKKPEDEPSILEELGMVPK